MPQRLPSLVPQPGQLVNLPDNVLNLILQNVAHVAPLQLQVLAFLCKRLNTMALSVLLSRLGVPRPPKMINLTLQAPSKRSPSRLDALSCLRVALSVTSTDRLCCTLDFRESSQEAFFKSVRRLSGFLSRLRFVTELQITLTGGIQTLEFSKDPGTMSRWDSLISQLRDVVTRKPNSRLLLKSAGWMSRTYASASHPIPRRAGGSRFDFPIRRLLGADKQSFEADSRLATAQPRERHAAMRSRSLSQPCIPRVSLISVSIENALLLGPYSEWTLSLLRSSAALSSLVLANLRQFNGHQWSQHLQQIAAAVPFLTHLEVSDPNILPKDLLSFLSKVQLLENLKIDRELRMFSPASHPYPKLSHLASISAPPEYIALLLSVRGGLPHLRDMEIALQNISYVASPHTAEMYCTIFHRMKEASPSVSPSPSTSPLPSAISFSHHLHHHSFPGIHLVPSLNVYVGTSAVSTNLIKSIDGALSMGADWQKRMKGFTKIVLNDFPLVDAATDISIWGVLSRWLGIMPELEVIEFRGTEALTAQQRVSLQPMIRALSYRCSRVRKVIINDIEHEVTPLVVPSTRTLLLPPSSRATSRSPSPLPSAVVTPTPSSPTLVGGVQTPMSLCAGKGFSVTEIPALPESVLERIIKHASGNLYPLALVCRRFNFLAVSRMLSQFDIPNPAVKVHIAIRENPATPDELTALQVAIHIPSIDHLSIKFPRNMTTYQFFDQVYKIRRLVSRLTYLSKLTIDFGVGATEHLKTANDALLSRWAGLMGSLLNATLEKSCHSLTVVGGAHFLQAYVLKKKREALLFKESSNPMKGSNWQFTRTPEQGSETVIAELSPHALTGQVPPLTAGGHTRTSNLRSLTIESEILLRPPFLTWTIAAIKTAPLARLEIVDLPAELSIVLPLIADAAPRLTELSISGDIQPEDVLGFLDKLPQLRSLSLGRSLYLDQADADSGKLPLPKIRKLTHLSAPMEFIPYLLSQFIPDSCDVPAPGGVGFIPPLKSLTVVLSNASLTNPSHITLANNILGISRLLQSLHMNSSISLDISVPPTTAWAARDISIVSVNEPRWENAMKVIANVTLRNYDAMHYGIGDPTQPLNRVIPMWLQLFPGLQTVVIAEKMQSEPAVFLGLVNAVIRACPDLTYIQVNSKCYRPERE